MTTCRVEGCWRPVYARDRCGFHALQAYYRAEAVRGAGLAAARRPRPPEMVVVSPDEAADREGR